MRILIVILLLSTFRIKAETASIVEIRSLYYSSAKASKAANQFLELMKYLDVSKDKVYQGYRGMAYILQAKYTWNPYSKLSSFDKGKEDLEQSIQADKQNIELRFLRFCIQTNVPSILNYQDNIEEDKTVILKAWDEINDKDLKARIKAYLLESEKLNEQEILLIKG